jgi:hypothetical protein
MQTTTVIVNNAAALQAANEAKVTACKALMGQYDSHTATVQEVKDYGNCVQLVYPEPISGEGLLIAKVLIVCVLVGLVTGFVRI